MEVEHYTVIQNRLLDSYQALGFTNEEFMFLIHLIRFQQQGDQFPAIASLANQMGYANQQVYQMLETLIEKGGLNIEADAKEGVRHGDRYSLAPLFEKLDAYEHQQEEQEQQVDHEEEVGTIFTLLEQEFSRLLTPLEYQEVSRWVSEDGYEVDTIKDAIREAVLNQVYNLRYIERILINWRKKNRKTTRYQPPTQTPNDQKPHFPIRKVLGNDNNKK
ncbi:MAG: DnaD domain protein [Aerococcus sp.]|nr:DnaD domain protein [Aerococcus sp.]